MTQIKSSGCHLSFSTWFTSDTMLFTYCGREALSALLHPFREETSCGFCLWCAPTLVCMSVYMKTTNVHSQCFHTEKSAQLEVLLLISVSIVNQ